MLLPLLLVIPVYSYLIEVDTFLRARRSELTYAGKFPQIKVKALSYFKEGGVLVSTDANSGLIARVLGGRFVDLVGAILYGTLVILSETE